MMNDSPDDRALAAYTARARHHESTITLANEALVGLQGPDRAELVSRVLTLREQAQQGLGVMEVLASAWRRDVAERQARRDEWEREIRERFKRFTR